MDHIEQSLMAKLAEMSKGCSDAEMDKLAELLSGEDQGEEGIEVTAEEIAVIEQLEKEASELSDEELAQAIELASNQVHPQVQDDLIKEAAAEIEEDMEKEAAEQEYWQSAGAALCDGFYERATEREASQSPQAKHASQVEQGLAEKGSTILAALGLNQ
jgi:hypothetical protein